MDAVEAHLRYDPAKLDEVTSSSYSTVGVSPVLAQVGRRSLEDTHDANGSRQVLFGNKLEKFGDGLLYKCITQ